MYKKVSLFPRNHLLSIRVMFLFSDWGSFISKSENNRKMVQYSLGTQIINCNIQSFHFIKRVWVSVCWSLLALVISMMTGSREKFSNSYVHTPPGHCVQGQIPSEWTGLGWDRNSAFGQAQVIGNASFRQQQLDLPRIKAWAYSQYLSFHVVLALSKQVSLFANKTDFVAKEVLLWRCVFLFSCYPNRSQSVHI